MLAPLNAREAGSALGGPTFSFGNRVARAVWNVTWLLLASWTPPPLHGWRRFLLRCFGAKIASTARIYGSARIWYPPHLSMGAYSILGWQALCYCQSTVEIQEHAVVSQRSHLCTSTHDADSIDFQLIAKPIVIERYAWVASDAFVGPGVRLREGAVLGGRGAAFNDLEAWTVYGGNPARVLRKRTNFLREEPSRAGDPTIE